MLPEGKVDLRLEKLVSIVVTHPGRSRDKTRRFRHELHQAAGARPALSPWIEPGFLADKGVDKRTINTESAGWLPGWDGVGGPVKAAALRIQARIQANGQVGHSRLCGQREDATRQRFVGATRQVAQFAAGPHGLIDLQERHGSPSAGAVHEGIEGGHVQPRRYPFER